MSKNYSPPDYGEYRLQGREGMLYALEGAAVVAMIGYFFYHSLVACLCLTPVFFLFLSAVFFSSAVPSVVLIFI